MADPIRDGVSGQAPTRRAIEAEAGEGLLLAEYATRMRLKNRIIIDIVTAQGSIEPEAWADEARRVLGGLRIEAEVSARRMTEEEALARSAHGSAAHQHDYHAPDADNLDRRRRVYRLVARRLLSWENDPAQVAVLLEAARHDAQEEIDAALTRAVGGDPGARVENEDRLRERLRLIATVDLPALEAAVRGDPAPVPARRRWFTLRRGPAAPRPPSDGPGTGGERGQAI